MSNANVAQELTPVHLDDLHWATVYCFGIEHQLASDWWLTDHCSPTVSSQSLLNLRGCGVCPQNLSLFHLRWSSEGSYRRRKISLQSTVCLQTRCYPGRVFVAQMLHSKGYTWFRRVGLAIRTRLVLCLSEDLSKWISATVCLQVKGVPGGTSHECHYQRRWNVLLTLAVTARVQQGCSHEQLMHSFSAHTYLVYICTGH